MNTNKKPSRLSKILKIVLVAAAITVVLAYPVMAAGVAVAAVVIWAYDKQSTGTPASCEIGCANAPSGAVVAPYEAERAKDTPSKREVMRSWVALF